jgi:serine/threonine protein kinase
MALAWQYNDIKHVWTRFPGWQGASMFTYTHQGQNYVIKILGDAETAREAGFLNAAAAISVAVKGYIISPRGTRFGIIMPALTTFQRSVQYPLPIKIDLFRQIRDLITRLHSQYHIIHGDIKLSNLLLDYDNSSSRWIVKLCDFGCATWTDRTTYPTKFTTQWASPYRLGADYQNRRALIPEEDIYAAAITVWEIFVGEVPFASITDEDDLEEQIKNGLKVDVSRIEDPEACSWVYQALANEKCRNRN